MANFTHVSGATADRSKNSIGIRTWYLLNASVIEVDASEPTAASLLSGLPSPSRSKPSVELPIASDEMIESSLPAYGVTDAPMHSGFGWNSGGSFPDPPQATSTKNGAANAADESARVMTPPRGHHTQRVSRGSTSA